jgi:hypothetical protein
MAPLPNVPNVLKIQLQHEVSADADVLDRIYAQYTGSAPTVTNLNTYAATIAASWATHLAPLMSTAGHLLGVTVTDLSSSSAAQGATAVTTAGSRAGSFMTAQVAALVNFHISRRYRGGKPRVYMPMGVAGDLVSAQAWNTAFVTAMTTGWSTFIGAIIPATVGGATVNQQVNVSYFNGFTVVTSPTTGRSKNVPTPRVSPLVDQVNSFTVSTIPASQRRRNRA